MDYRLHIARRYLLGQRRVSLISVITAVSTTGVTLGVAALIVVLSVMNGFYDVVRDLLVSYDPHVRIVPANAQQNLTATDSLLAVAGTLPHVEAAAPYVEGKALLLHEGTTNANQVVQVRGIDLSALPKKHRPSAAFGAFAFNDSLDGPPGAVVDVGLGQRLGLTPGRSSQSGSTIGLLSATALERTLTQLFGPPPLQRFTVRGLYRTQQAALDGSRVFISLEAAQALFRTGTRVSGIDLRLDDLERAAQVKATLEARLGTERFAVETWYDARRSLYDVMRLEKWGASAILLLIVIVAAFNIVGSLTMVVIEKRRDVGVLQAMGVSPANIRRIFLLEGALIGGVGTGLGLMLGLALALLQKHFNLVPMAQAESFLIDAYPVSIHLLDVSLIAGTAFALCVLAAIYPAVRAAAIEPARAVHLDG